jgi:hypothetical protein
LVADAKEATQPSAHTETTTKATAVNLTGHYESVGGDSLDVLELPNHRIKFGLLAIFPKEPYASKKPNGPNIGDVSGELPVKDGVAVYRDSDSGGTINMHFHGRSASLQQKGNIAGFGMGVTADGMYKRKSSKPQF